VIVRAGEDAEALLEFDFEQITFLGNYNAFLHKLERRIYAALSTGCN